MSTTQPKAKKYHPLIERIWSLLCIKSLVTLVPLIVVAIMATVMGSQNAQDAMIDLLKMAAAFYFGTIVSKNLS